MGKKFICLLLCVVCILPILSGCAGSESKRELDSLAIVIGLAIDLPEDKNSDEILLTAQVVHNKSVSQDSSSGGGSSSEGKGDLGKSFWNVKSEGVSLIDAMISATHITNRQLYVAHNQVIIFSKEVAQQGIGQYIDHFLRDHETRYDVNIIISDEKAADVLSVESHLEVLPAQDLGKLIERQKENGHNTTCSLFLFAREFKIPYKSVLVPIVKVVTPEDSEKESPYLKIEGSGVFKDDKMTAELDENQTLGVMWILGDVDSGYVSFKFNEADVTLDILDGGGQFKPEYKDGKILIKADAQATCTLSEFRGSGRINTDMLKELEKKCEEELKNKMQSGFDAIKESQSDVLGIGEYFYRFHNGTWQTMSEKFLELYKNAELEISMNVEIIRTGSLLDQAGENGGELYD